MQLTPPEVLFFCQDVFVAHVAGVIQKYPALIVNFSQGMKEEH